MDTQKSSILSKSDIFTIISFLMSFRQRVCSLQLEQDVQIMGVLYF